MHGHGHGSTLLMMSTRPFTFGSMCDIDYIGDVICDIAHVIELRTLRGPQKCSDRFLMPKKSTTSELRKRAQGPAVGLGPKE